jgi:hypothetical protein
VPKRRLSVAATVEGYFAAMTNSKESGTPEEIKRLAVTLLGRMQAHKQAVAQVRKSVVLTKRKRGHLDAHVAQEKELQAEHGLQLPECTNKHTMASLEAQFRTLEARKEGQEETLESLELAAPFVFDSWDELLEFFKDQGVGFSRDSLGRWAKGLGFVARGVKPAFDAVSEQMLIDAILLCDGLGQPMGVREICALAAEYAVDPAINARFSDDGPTAKWYKGFIERAKQAVPELVLALQRGTDCRTLKWFNTANIDWWFGLFNDKIRKYGFARAPKDGEEGESVWLPGMLQRVVVSDETCVSGGGQRKAANPKKKVVTKKDRLEHCDKGAGYRRVVETCGSTQEHITGDHLSRRLCRTTDLDLRCKERHPARQPQGDRGDIFQVRRLPGARPAHIQRRGHQRDLYRHL